MTYQSIIYLLIDQSLLWFHISKQNVGRYTSESSKRKSQIFQFNTNGLNIFD